MLLSIVAIFFSVASAIESLSGNNGPIAKSADLALMDVPLVLDADWTNFLFTNVGVPVVPNFIFVTPISPPTFLQVTDLYCAGDMFVVANSGAYLATTTPPLFTDCQLSTNNATLAHLVPYWSSFSILLPPLTPFNLTIIPSQSPWTAGQAAIRWITVSA
jgi:hypothetical protein